MGHQAAEVKHHETVGGHLVASVLHARPGECLGMLLPWIIARSGRDPAFGSGPLATVTQDVVTLLVYFAIVKAYGL